MHSFFIRRLSLSLALLLTLSVVTLLPLRMKAAGATLTPVIVSMSSSGTPSTSLTVGTFRVFHDASGGVVVSEMVFESSGDSSLSTAQDYELYVTNPQTGAPELVSDTSLVSGSDITFNGLSYAIDSGIFPTFIVKANTVETRNALLLNLTSILAVDSADDVTAVAGLPLQVGSLLFDQTTPHYKISTPGEFKVAFIERMGSARLMRIQIETDVSFTLHGLLIDEDVAGEVTYRPTGHSIVTEEGSFAGTRQGDTIVFSGVNVPVVHDEIKVIDLYVNASEASGEYQVSVNGLVLGGTTATGESLDDGTSALSDFPTPATSALTPGFDMTITKSTETTVLDMTLSVEGIPVVVDSVSFFTPTQFVDFELRNLDTGETLKTIEPGGMLAGTFDEGKTFTLSEGAPVRIGIVADTSQMTAGSYNFVFLNASGHDEEDADDFWMTSSSEVYLSTDIQLVEVAVESEPEPETVLPSITASLASESPSGNRDGASQDTIMRFRLFSSEEVTVTSMQFTMQPSESVVSDFLLVRGTDGTIMGQGSVIGGTVFMNGLSLSIDGEKEYLLVADTTQTKGELKPILSSITSSSPISVSGLPKSGHTLDFGSVTEEVETEVSISEQETVLETTQVSDQIVVSEQERQEIFDRTVTRERAAVKQVDSGLVERVKGRILLQVESVGEAWYVNPNDGRRRYLQDGQSAYQALRDLGLGISNTDLARIPIGLESRFQSVDTDGDGLADQLEDSLGTDKNDSDSDDDGFPDGVEIANGYSPLGAGRLTFDQGLVDRLRGHILLQVEGHGEAWYVNPDDGKRYYMKDGDFAYEIMRFLGLGITSSDLSRIPLD